MDSSPNHNEQTQTITSPPPLLRPLPRRPFTLSTPSGSPFSSDSSIHHTPTSSTADSTHDLLDTQNASFADPSASFLGTRPNVSRSKSILNLTSSTLFGIYAPTSLTEQSSTPQTPWGTGAETPVHRENVDSVLGSLAASPGFVRPNAWPSSHEIEDKLRRHAQREGKKIKALESGRWSANMGIKVNKLVSQCVLFCLGVSYGALVARLRGNSHFSNGLASGNGTQRLLKGLDTSTMTYLSFWGLAGLVMGNLLPWIDSRVQNKTQKPRHTLNAVHWSDVVRSIGAFIGIAFAIRKLPWETTLQLSLTLSLTNPFLWYLLDRTKAGFLLSSSIGLCGTALLLVINPELIPAPTQILGGSSQGRMGDEIGNSTLFRPNGDFGTVAGARSGNGAGEYFGVATWICSVLFCSCVCFGSIGRLLVS